MTKWIKSTLVLLAMTALVLSGCGAKLSPKEAATNAFAKTVEMKSYAFTTSIRIDDLQLGNSVLEDPAAAGIVSMLKSVKLDITGVASQEPLRADMKIGIEIPGDMAIKVELPLIMTQDKMYMKVPAIPMLELPEELVGKYLELDMKALAEESGQDVSKMMDTATAQKMSNEFMKEVVGKFDEKTYFSAVDVKSANLPEDVKAKQVVKFAITKDNFDAAATTFVKDALPAILDLVSKDEYRNYLQLEQADIDQLRTELTTTDSEFQKGLEEMKKSLTVNEVSIVTAIDKDQYPVFQNFLIDLAVDDAGEQMKLKLNMTNKMTNINGQQTFGDIPTDVVSMEQFEQLMMGGF